MPTTTAKPRAAASGSTRAGSSRPAAVRSSGAGRNRPLIQPGRRRARTGLWLTGLAVVVVGVYAILALPHAGDVPLFAMIGVVAVAPTALTGMLLGISSRRAARRHRTAPARYATAAIVAGALVAAVGVAALVTIVVVLVRIQTGTL